MDNMTADDAMTAGKTLLKGGSKEDAAMAVVKGRAEDKVESMTGTKVDLDDLSKDGMKDAGKDIAMDKAKGSATKYMGQSTEADSDVSMSKDGMMDAGKDMAMDKAKSSSTTYGDKAANSSTTYGDKAAGSHTTNSAPVIPKSGDTMVEPAASTPTAAPINCPAGTKDAGDGTCMITGDWKF